MSFGMIHAEKYFVKILLGFSLFRNNVLENTYIDDISGNSLKCVYLYIMQRCNQRIVTFIDTIC